jgi:hypothetical protein
MSRLHRTICEQPGWAFLLSLLTYFNHSNQTLEYCLTDTRVDQ